MLFAIFFCHRLDDDTLFTHLVQGRALFTAAAFDAFSLSPWWVTDGLLYLPAKLSGTAVLHFLPALFAAALIILFTRCHGPFPGFICGTALLVLSYPHHYPLSIDWTGYACGLWFVYTLTRGSRALLALALCQLLWSNLHPTFFVGIVSLALAIFCGRRQTAVVDPWRLPHLAVIVAVSLISPYSVRAGWYAAVDWLSTVAVSPFVYWWPGWCLMCVACLWLLWRRQDWQNCSLLALWMTLGWLQPRWMVAALLLALFYSLALLRAPDRWWYSLRLPAVTLAAVIVVLRVGQIDNLWCGRWGTGIDNSRLPVAVARFVGDIPVGGKLFGNSSRHGYLAWATGQALLAPARFAPWGQDLQDLGAKPQAFADLARRLDIQVAVLFHAEPASENLTVWLASQLNWHAVYCDELSLVFVRNDAPLLATITRYKLRDQHVPPVVFAHDDMERQASSYYRRANVLLRLGLVSSALSDLEAGTARAPDSPARFLLQGRMALLQGEQDKARQHFVAAWKKERSPEAGELVLKTCLEIATPEALREGVAWCEEMVHTVEWPRLMLYKAQFLHLQGNKETAALLLQTLLRQHPNDSQAREYLDHLQQQIASDDEDKILQQVRELVRQQKKEQALDLIDKEIARGRANAELHLEAGKLHFHARRFARALDCFKQVVETVPQHLAGNCYLSMCLASLGRWQEALQLLAGWQEKYQDRYEVRLALEWVDTIAIDALKQDGDAVLQNADRALRLVSLLERRQRVEEALTLLARWGDGFLVKQADRDVVARVYYQAGNRLLQDHKVETALEYLEHSTRLSPSYFEAHLLLAEIALKKRDWENARRHFEALRRIAPHDDRGPSGLALIELGKGLSLQLQDNYAEALEKFSLYLQKAPTSPEKRAIAERIANLQKMCAEQDKEKRARALLEAGTKALVNKQCDAAIASLEQAVSLLPELAEVHFHLGQAYLQKKSWQQAEQSLVKAVALKPHLAAAHLSLGYLFYQQGRFNEVKPHFTAYLQHAPDGKFAAQVKSILQSIETIK